MVYAVHARLLHLVTVTPNPSHRPCPRTRQHAALVGSDKFGVATARQQSLPSMEEASLCASLCVRSHPHLRIYTSTRPHMTPTRPYDHQHVQHAYSRVHIPIVHPYLQIQRVIYLNLIMHRRSRALTIQTNRFLIYTPITGHRQTDHHFVADFEPKLARGSHGSHHSTRFQAQYVCRALRDWVRALCLFVIFLTQRWLVIV